MSVKRASEFENGALVPVAKRVRNEVATYAAKQNRSVTRNSNLLSPIMLLSGHEGEIFTCKFSPQGDIIASAGFERKIFLWNVYGDCENWAVLMGHGGAIMDLQFNEDGSEMVSCSTDKSIFIWDINTCERIKKLKGHKSFVNSVSIARTGSVPLICSGSDDSTVKVWDRRQKGASLTYDNKYQVLSVAFNKTGEQIFFGGIDNQIKVWDTRMAGGELLYTLRGHTDSITGLSISHDGNYIASNAMDNTIRLWDVRPFAPQERCVKIFIGHMHNFEKNLLRVSWSPQDDRIAAGSADKFVYVWDVNSQRILYKLPGHTGCVNEVDFHPLEPISKFQSEVILY